MHGIIIQQQNTKEQKHKAQGKQPRTVTAWLLCISRCLPHLIVEKCPEQQNYKKEKNLLVSNTHFQLVSLSDPAQINPHRYLLKDQLAGLELQ